MKAGNIIEHIFYTELGHYEVIEVDNRKMGVTEIVMHPVGDPDKLSAGWARYWKVVREEKGTSTQQAEAIKEYIEANVETLTEVQLIDNVIALFNNHRNPPALWTHLNSTPQRAGHGNWYWLIRRIRNTGAYKRITS